MTIDCVEFCNALADDTRQRMRYHPQESSTVKDQKP